MTWTYGGDPSANDRDQIRFMLGDTDTTDQLISDGEIAGAITLYSNVLSAAIFCCNSIAAKYARLCNTSNTAGLSVQAAQRYEHYKNLADELRKQNALDAAIGATFWVGGAEKSDVDSMNDSSTYVQPSFKLGMDDYSHSDTESTIDDD